MVMQKTAEKALCEYGVNPSAHMTTTIPISLINLIDPIKMG
jgi:hypothetical protein